MAASVLREKAKQFAKDMVFLCRVFLRTLGSFIRLTASGICFASDIASQWYCLRQFIGE